MKASQIIQFCAKQEAKLDHHLFALKDDELTPEEGRSVLSDARNRTAAGAAVAGAAGLGGLALVTSKPVNNRLGGMRATVPGFTQRSPLAQRAIATGSVVKDALGPVPGQVAGAARTAVAGARRAGTRAVASYTNARNTAGMGVLSAGLRAGKKVVNPLIGGLKRIARIGA